MQIYLFHSVLRPVLWGGSKLAAYKRLPASPEPIGESWELSGMPGREPLVANGEEAGLTLTELLRCHGADLVGEDVYRRYGNCFPLLIKLIDANRDLSVQVHPGDEQARRLHDCMGKNEMWYIVDAEAGAMIRTGFNHNMTAAEYDRRVGDGTIIDAMNSTSSQPDDIFFIPAGQIHTIGAGNLLVEIQQSCDITYRVWDYNRRDADGNLRELHTALAREALDFAAHDCKVRDVSMGEDGITPLIKCEAFEVCRLDVDSHLRLELPRPHSFIALVCVKGETTLCVEGMPKITLHQGETCLVPAIVDGLDMTGKAQLLMTMVPTEN